MFTQSLYQRVDELGTERARSHAAAVVLGVPPVANIVLCGLSRTNHLGDGTSGAARIRLRT
jgi:hypothetical protein